MAGAEPESLPSEEMVGRAFEITGHCPCKWAQVQKPHLAEPGADNWMETAMWVGWYYDSPESEWPEYQNCIDVALKLNKVQSLHVLWTGVYYHDRDNPDFEEDLLTAARHSNLETFLFALHARRTYSTLNGYNAPDFEVFARKIAPNPELASWWGDVDNQRAIYDLLGAHSDEAGTPLAGESLREAILAEEADHNARTVAILSGWL